MIDRRYAVLAVIIAACATLAACDSLGEYKPADISQYSRVIYKYTAFGASDAVGVGASVMCDPAGLVANPACPGGTGYVPDIANILGAAPNQMTLNDLGISGAVVGPDVKGLLLSCPAFAASLGGNALHDFDSDELPLYPVGENLVTIFAGGNDVRDLFIANGVLGCGINTATYFNAFAFDLQTLVQTAHALNPFAHIYIADLPNFGLIPLGVCIGANPASPPAFCGANNPPQGLPIAQAGLGIISELFDLEIFQVFAANLPMADLLCNAQSYVPTNFTPDGFHPDDAGYAALAASYVNIIKAVPPPAPSFTCAQATFFPPDVHAKIDWAAMRSVRLSEGLKPRR